MFPALTRNSGRRGRVTRSKRRKVESWFGSVRLAHSNRMQTTIIPAFRKTTDIFAPGAKTLPQRYFVSAEVFAQEEAAIFSARWVVVGHQSQIARPGDYFVQEVAGESLIIMRDRE